MGVDMGAIPETLFESELFGHQKGAFTGAVQDKPGRFELAEKGTLFLDEIGNLPVTMQTKLLTVLEQRTIRRIGSGHAYPHRYPADLGYQSARSPDGGIGIVPARSALPPQYHRTGHSTAEGTQWMIFPLLAAHFLREASRKYGKPGLEISKKSMKQLQQYNWPGNVRELQNTMASGR